jgi:hypothetical protein
MNLEIQNLRLSSPFVEGKEALLGRTLTPRGTIYQPGARQIMALGRSWCSETWSREGWSLSGELSSLLCLHDPRRTKCGVVERLRLMGRLKLKQTHFVFIV